MTKFINCDLAFYRAYFEDKTNIHITVDLSITICLLMSVNI